MVDTTAYPYRTIVRINDQIGGRPYQGSGVLISPDEVLTAAHVVWIAGVGVASNIVVTPGYSGGAATFGTVSGSVTHYYAISNAYDLITFADTAYDYAIIHLATPQTVGFMAIGADFSGGVATVGGYPVYAAGLQVDVTESFSQLPGYTVLTGADTGSGSSGGPIFTIGTDGATVLGTVSSGVAGGAGYFNEITSAERAKLLAWIAQDDGYSPVAGFIDSATGARGTVPLSPSSPGGPIFLQWQYIWASSDGVSMSTSAPNAFLHGGPGQDSLQVTAGQNVLDGGAGSNFLTGGTGSDTFFTDARGAAVVWNTLRNFHAGDAATLWGFVPGVSSYSWDAQPAGAAGYTGATLRANIIGGHGRSGDGIDASITFAGLSVAQAKSLQFATGTQPAGSYLYVYNQGV